MGSTGTGPIAFRIVFLLCRRWHHDGVFVYRRAPCLRKRTLASSNLEILSELQDARLDGRSCSAPQVQAGFCFQALGLSSALVRIWVIAAVELIAAACASAYCVRHGTRERAKFKIEGVSVCNGLVILRAWPAEKSVQE